MRVKVWRVPRQDKKSVNLTIRLDEELDAAVSEMELATGVSRGVMVRSCLQALTAFFTENGHLQMPVKVVAGSKPENKPPKDKL